MSDSKHTRISVPKELGDEITVRWDGDDPTTYKVSDGHVNIENENADRFLGLIDGSKVINDHNKTDATASSK